MADGRIIIDTDIDSSGAEGGVSKLSGKLKGIASTGLKAFVGSVTVASTALAGLGAKATMLASDLTEVQNVVDVTFGDNASKIDDWSKSAATAFGIGELQAKKFNGTMGAMLKSMGLTSDEVLDMSKNLSGLSGDFASFYNLDPQEAFDKIRSGISGETEPLKQLGINMSVANLETYALTQGIEKQYKEMTQGEQATLRYNYLMSVSADAQGDFARTSDSLANQLRIAKLSVQDLGGAIGKSLIPVAQEGIKKINGFVTELKDAFNNGGFEGLANKFGDVLSEITIEISNQLPKFAELSVKIIQSLIDGLDKNSKTLAKNGAKIVSALIKGIKDVIPEMAKLGIDLISSFFEAMFDKNVGSDVKDILKDIYKAFENFSKNIVSITKTVFPPFIKVLKGAADNLDTLIPLLVSGYIAFKAFSIIKTITTAMEGYTLVTKLAALAQAALNTVMAANPILLVIGALATLTAGVASYLLITGDEKTETDKLTKSINENAQSYRDAKKSQEDKVNSGLAELDNTQKLWNELQNLSDANGKVADSDKTRAQFILNELNNALGTEYSMTGDVIDQYGELGKSIDELILKKKAMLVLETEEDSYKAAIENKAKAEKQVHDAKVAMDNTEMKLSKAKDELESAYGIQGKQRARDEVDSLTNKLDEQKKAYDKSNETLNGYYTDWATYETNSQLMLEGGAENYKKILDNSGMSLKNSSNTTKGELENQQTDWQNYYNSIKDGVDNSGNKVNQSIIDWAKRNADSASTEYQKVGQNIMEGIQVGIDSRAVSLIPGLGGMTNAALKYMQINSPSRLMRDKIGKYILPGIQVGIEKTTPDLKNQFIKSLQTLDNVNVSSLYSRMNSSVSSQIAKTTASVASTRTGITSNSTTVNNNIGGTIEVPVMVEGREIARASAPYQYEFSNYNIGR